MAAASRAGDPPESTRLRLGDDIAWSEINGVYDRDDSLKENTNPKCLLKSHPHHNGSSQRFSGNLKPTAAPIIGLSGKLGAQGGGARRQQQHHPPAIFPKKARTGGGGRAPRAAVPEPESPKVSCIGKVLSDRERARFGRPPRPRGGSRPPGCCGGLGFLMRRSRSRNSAVECVGQSPPAPSLPPLAEAARRSEAKVAEAEAEEETAPAPGLGGMLRFASGRRAPEWAAAMEEDDGRVARSGPL
ncbi:hypothetical protein PAHAL_8G038500 [Panicum hallii]|jgi:hypothetical protein|uniref:Uncharacterized protein n=1 Tax=Panicum hallii TaxID=206008 RepID=A0A2S3ICL0_9POAL|nr:uncharacterized protein LOC112901969 [Panicum hallii]PAN41369.1 hypothetical protein PAHAL_8G038500 [Panicum hallii]